MVIQFDEQVVIQFTKHPFCGSVEFPVGDTELVAKHQDLKILVMVRYAADADKFQ